MGRPRFDPALDTAIRCTPRAPADARRAVAQLESELDPAILCDMQLLVSELVTNSVRHSGSEEPIRLRVWALDDGLKVEVVDGGIGFERGSAPGDETEGGRGLLILETLAERWGVTGGGRGHVWFELATAG